MKSVPVCLAVLLLTLGSWAQTAPSTPPEAQTPPPSGAPMHHHGMPGMPPEHMQQMKAQVEKMSATVAQMKTNLAKIKDPAARQQAQLDAELWDSMVKHMQGMVDMMSEHQESGMMQGMGMMDHDGMAMKGDCCGGMKEGGGCCGDMKGDMKAGGCCGGGKCMKPNTPAAASSPSGNSE